MIHSPDCPMSKSALSQPPLPTCLQDTSPGRRLHHAAGAYHPGEGRRLVDSGTEAGLLGTRYSCILTWIAGTAHVASHPTSPRSASEGDRSSPDSSEATIQSGRRAASRSPCWSDGFHRFCCMLLAPKPALVRLRAGRWNRMLAPARSGRVRSGL